MISGSSCLVRFLVRIFLASGDCWYFYELPASSEAVLHFFYSELNSFPAHGPQIFSGYAWSLLSVFWNILLSLCQHTSCLLAFVGFYRPPSNRRWWIPVSTTMGLRVNRPYSFPTILRVKIRCLKFKECHRMRCFLHSGFITLTLNWRQQINWS